MEGTTQADNELRDRARSRIKARRGLMTHAAVYVVFNALFWVIWAVNDSSSDSGVPWPAYVTVLWGIGLAIQAWSTFRGGDITESDVDREMERMNAR